MLRNKWGQGRDGISRFLNFYAQQMLTEWKVLILELKLLVNFKVVLDG